MACVTSIVEPGFHIIAHDRRGNAEIADARIADNGCQLFPGVSIAEKCFHIIADDR